MRTSRKRALLFLGLMLLVLTLGIVAAGPYIFTWGSTGDEVSMPMPGDEIAPFISSTRSITINAPMPEVWDWLIQLGADRGGFYSYWFIEGPLGYVYRERKRVEPEFKDMEVGRVVRASLEPSESAIAYSWPVVAVDPGKSFVLKGWGGFLLREIGPGRTRLSVRTHWRKMSGLADHLEYFLMMPAHYLMERRMLMGIKARAEAGPGVPLSSTPDIIWFLGILLSLPGIAAMVLIKPSLKAGALSLAYSVLWLLALFILPPTPLYSLLLFLAVTFNLGWLIRTRKRNAPSSS